MIFINPLGLLGLLTLPVIVGLHLFRERNRRKWVSDLSLWAFLEKEVRGTRPQRIPITLLLVLDLLIALLLSLAWAQPQITVRAPFREARHHIVLLDTSLSMNSRDSLPTRFQQAVLFAGNYLNTIGPRDVVTVITFGDRPEIIGDTRVNDLQVILDALTGLEASQRNSDWHSGLVFGMAVLDPGLKADFHIFTDLAFPAPQNVDFPYPLTINNFGYRDFNQAVSAIEYAFDPEGNSQVFARLNNYSAQPQSRQVMVLFDDQPVDSAFVSLPPHSSRTQLWTIKGKPDLVTVAFVSPDDLPLDDTASMGVNRVEQVSVVLVADQPEPVAKAVGVVPQAALRVVAPRDYSPLIQADLTIFKGYIPDALPSGSVFLVEPRERSSPNSMPALVLGGQVTIPPGSDLRVRDQDMLLVNLDLSSVIWRDVWTVEDLPESFETIIQSGGYPVLIRGQVGSSSVMILLDDFSSGNFSRHPVFPLFFSNLITSAVAAPLPAVVLNGEPLILPSSAGYRSLEITAPDGHNTRLAQDWDTVWTDTFTPGVFQVETEDIDGKRETHYVGVNLMGSPESDILPQRWPGNTLNVGTAVEDSQARQISLMPWLLVLAGLISFFEAYLAWR